VTVTSNGYYGTPFVPQYPNQPASGSANALVHAGQVVSASLSPETLDLSTGDTNRYITTSVSPSSTPFTAVYSFSAAPVQPAGGQCNASLTIPNGSGTGSVSSQVTASVEGCSRVFNVIAAAGGVSSQNWTQVTVPPQILIQMLNREAGGQIAEGDMSQLSIAVAARNRFGDDDFGDYGTYQEVVTSAFQWNSDLHHGPDRELGNAARVYRNDSSTQGIIEDAKCLWSPRTAQWALVQAALQSQTTVFPSGTGSPSCWQSSGRQILYKTSIGLNANGGDYAGAPAFLFVRERSANDPAVRQIN